MADSSDNPQQSSWSQNFLQVIKNVSPYGILLGCFAVGLGTASAFWAATVSGVQNDMRRSEAELTRVKGEFAEYRAKYPQENANATKNSSVITTQNSNSQNSNSTETNGKTIVTVKSGETVSANIFGDQILISLISTSFEGEPPSYKVAATIAASGFEPMKMERAEVGDLITYKGKVKYDVRILDVNSFSARFSLARKQN